MMVLSHGEQEILDQMLARRPDLAPCVDNILELHAALVACYDGGGKLMLCGNGGSNADAMHIAGELCKSFERKRPLSAQMKTALQQLPLGDALAAHLETGLPAISTPKPAISAGSTRTTRVGCRSPICCGCSPAPTSSTSSGSRATTSTR